MSKSKRGGARTPGPGKKLGRPKVERVTTNKVAGRVLAQVNAEQKWLKVIRLAEAKADATNNTADLANALRYLEDREYGKTVDTVNHLHDKPIDVNVNLSIAEVVREIRQRKQEYERSGR